MNPANGTMTIYSAVPTSMEWTQIGATAFFQGNPRPTQRNKSAYTIISKPNNGSITRDVTQPTVAARNQAQRVCQVCKTCGLKVEERSEAR
jgi:hypothetical protein